MTQKELIELVRKTHPHMGAKEINKKLNIAQRKMCLQTKAIKGSSTGTSSAGTREYELSDMIEVEKVYLKDDDGNFKQIPRIVGSPSEVE